jgi:hypothetical protein
MNKHEAKPLANEVKRLGMKELREKRKKEKEGNDKRREQYKNSNKRKRSPQKRRVYKTNHKQNSRTREYEEIEANDKRREQYKNSNERKRSPQKRRVYKTNHEQNSRARKRNIKKQLKSADKAYEYGIISETVEQFYRNTGGIENEVPHPPSEEETKNIIKSFSKHVCPHFKRCQACGQETLSCDDDVEYHRVKVFLKNNINKRISHLVNDSKVLGRRGILCHQKKYISPDGNNTVWLAVCNPNKPETLCQRFFAKLNDSILICKECLNNTNLCGFKKFDVGRMPLHIWRIQAGLDEKYTKLNILEE